MYISISQLEQLINHHNDLYWNNKPLEISDTEYDKLVRQLQQLDPDNPLINKLVFNDNIPTDKLVIHKNKMLSLDKVYSFEELNKWVNKVSRDNNEQFLIQPKYDGMSGKLEDGKLSSRGDGIHGQDYTDKLQIIEFDTNRTNININKDYLLGEILIKTSTFKQMYNNGYNQGKIKSKSGGLFKNQRNGIAGIIGTDDTNFYKSQGAVITMVDYDKNSWPISKKDFSKERWENIVNTITTSTDYPLDGIVVKLSDKKYSETLGCTTHHPRGQIAFKFTNQQKQSKLIDIIWGMGKQQLTAVGVIEPVDFNGVTVKQVKLQLTKPKNSEVNSCLIDQSLQLGDNVIVERAGDIIPHIVSSTPGISRKVVNITHCPFCGSLLKINDTSIECTNINCKEKLIQNLYCSIVTLGFKNIGESFIRDLVNIGHVNNLYQLLSLQLHDLNDPCFGSKTKITFINEIEKALNNTDRGTFLACLNIPTLGKKVGELLSNKFTIDQLLNPSSNLVTEMQHIDGIGMTIIKEVLTGLYKNKDFIKNLLQLFKFKNVISNNSSDKNKKTICFTGKMEMKRSDMEAIAVERGLIPVDTVDKSLNILVCADPNSGSSKLQKAAKYGINIVSETDFINGKY